jgi:hypothetical protein
MRGNRTAGHIRPAFLAVAGLALAAPESAAVVHTVPDAYPTIQAAIDASSSGDTVEVRAGEYNESLRLAGKDLVVIGAGLQSTVLRPPAASRALHIGPGVTISTLFRGLSFALGEADSGGGAYVAADAASAFQYCRFLGNVARAPDRSLGGGLFVNLRGHVQLRGCEFRDNVADNTPMLLDANGGAICAVGGATVEADSTRFVHNTAAGFEGGFGGAVALGGDGYFNDCVFDSNTAGYGGCIGGLGFLLVSECRFRFNHGLHGPSTLLFFGDPYAIQSSVFHDNVALAGHTAQMGGTGTIEFNTFAFNQTGEAGSSYACLAWEGTSTTVRHNLVAQNRQIGLASVEPPPAGSLSCNDVWLNRDGNFGLACPDVTGFDQNLSVNPFFCDSTTRALHLRYGSACGSGGACGLIGALPEACPGAGVEPAAARAATQLLPARPHPLRRDRGGVLAFELPAPSHARLEILDVLGRRVAVVADGRFAAGRHDVPWSARSDDGNAVRPGVYVLNLEAGAIRLARRLVVVE